MGLDNLLGGLVRDSLTEVSPYLLLEVEPRLLHVLDLDLLGVLTLFLHSTVKSGYGYSLFLHGGLKLVFTYQSLFSPVAGLRV